jgi:hypothetical protein
MVPVIEGKEVQTGRVTRFTYNASEEEHERSLHTNLKPTISRGTAPGNVAVEKSRSYKKM